LTGASPSSILAHFREQAGWCRALGSPLTADLCLAFATDFESGGIIRSLTKDWPGNPRKDALALRLTGCLHHAALTGRSSLLQAAYPPTAQGASARDIWPFARDWLDENENWVRDFIKGAPQTNETRRCIAMLPAFLELAARFRLPMNLLELGASAGLNQIWDRYGYDAGAWSWPPAMRLGDTPVMTDWRGPAPAALDERPEIANREACDLNPVNLGDPEEVMRLKCYTWPDQPERLQRLDKAVELSRQCGVKVDRADARDWLLEKLANRPSGQLTIVYHSVFLIYPPRDVIGAIMSAIAAEGEKATDDKPLAWVCFESDALFSGNPRSPAMITRLQSWPGGEAKVLNRSDGHVTRVDAA
jgi:hypothetical protein